MNTATVIPQIYSNKYQFKGAEQELFDKLVTENIGAEEYPLDEVLKEMEKLAKFPV